MIKLCQSVHYNPWRKPLIIQQIHPAWTKEYCTLHETKHDWNRHQTCKYVHKRIFTAIHITAIEWNSDLETATSWDPRALLLGYSCPWTVVTAWNVGWEWCRMPDFIHDQKALEGAIVVVCSPVRDVQFLFLKYPNFPANNNKKQHSLICHVMEYIQYASNHLWLIPFTIICKCFGYPILFKAQQENYTKQLHNIYSTFFQDSLPKYKVEYIFTAILFIHIH